MYIYLIEKTRDSKKNVNAILCSERRDRAKMSKTRKEGDFQTSRRTRTVLRKIGQTRLVSLFLLALGIFALAFSVVYASSVLAFIGLGLTLWGALLLYITPSEHVPLELLNATATPNLTNIEKIMTAYDLKEKGVYLPPKYLENGESSLVYVPSKDDQTLPKPEEIDEQKLHSENPNGVLLSPPGIALSKLFEKTLGKSFTRTDLNYIQNNLPKLLVEDMEIAENVELKTEYNIVTLEIINHIFKEICQETRKLQKTHKALGCPLSSAIACILAKATGKPVIIESNDLSADGKTIKTKYRVLTATKT